MGGLSSFLLSIFFFIFTPRVSHLSSFLSTSAAPVSPPRCHPNESSALLQFKASLSAETSYMACHHYINRGTFYIKTSSWNESTNCCTWRGVTCDRATGLVVGLDLHCSSLRGFINSSSSLFFLRHLQSLDLSMNNFMGSPFAPEFGGFKNLTQLHLSLTNLSGFVPFEISRLSKLVSLQLEFSQNLRISEATFKALAQNSTSLRELVLGSVDLSFLSPVYLMNLSSSLTSLVLSMCNLRGKLPESVFQLPNLQMLNLYYNEGLAGSSPRTNWSSRLQELVLSNTGVSVDLAHLLENARSLSALSLGRCKFVGSYLPLFSNATQIVSLDLSNNNFTGPIPSWIYALPNLRDIDLSNNGFKGEIGEFRSNSLDTISLGSNKLQGLIPRSLFQKVNLMSVDLSGNMLTGNVDLEDVSKLKHLIGLGISFNNLSLIFDNSENYTFGSLRSLGLASCNISQFPNFLRSLPSLSDLDLSFNKIEGSVPKWLWEVSKDSMDSLNLSNNFLTYIDPEIPWKNLRSLDLHSNQFSCPYPILSSSRLMVLLSSQNQFRGEISTSFCNLTSLQVLDLSHNNLSGQIPSCLGNFSETLSVLDLRKNNLHGNIPLTFPTESSLRTLDLNGNRFEGSVPTSLVHCKELEYLILETTC